MRRRIWWIVGGGLVLLVLALVGPMIYAASEEDAPPARTVEAQPEGVELAPETDGPWTVGAGSSAGYRVDEVLNSLWDNRATPHLTVRTPCRRPSSKPT